MEDRWSAWTKDGLVKNPAPPKMTVINFSGGVQSTALVYMLLDGFLKAQSPVLVLNADPGMEMSGTKNTVREVFARCHAAGIPAYTAPGPNLYEHLLDTSQARLDNPPYFVAKEKGKRGRLRQKCTREFKIRPMDRAIRKEMRKRGIKLGMGVVEKWIGFPVDERHRFSLPSQQYIRFAFPLAHMGMTKQDVRQWLQDRGYPIPVRSVCAGCFAHAPADFCRMRTEDPAAFAKAVAVDKAVRHHPAMGAKYPVFVSDSLQPLEDLVETDDADRTELSCDSGYCFL